MGYFLHAHPFWQAGHAARPHQLSTPHDRAKKVFIFTNLRYALIKDMRDVHAECY